MQGYRTSKWVIRTGGCGGGVVGFSSSSCFTLTGEAKAGGSGVGSGGLATALGGFRGGRGDVAVTLTALGDLAAVAASFSRSLANASDSFGRTGAKVTDGVTAAAPALRASFSLLCIDGTPCKQHHDHHCIIVARWYKHVLTRWTTVFPCEIRWWAQFPLPQDLWLLGCHY